MLPDPLGALLQAADPAMVSPLGRAGTPVSPSISILPVLELDLEDAFAGVRRRRQTCPRVIVASPWLSR